jgi:head-tail adaptor
MSKLGDFYNYITIQRYTSAADDTGDVVLTWADLVSLFAERIEGGGTEKTTSDQITGINYVTWKIRYYPGLTVKDRISFESSYWQIENIATEGRKAFLHLKSYRLDG